jgi:ribosome-binding protein aMBF1 (putative translation factor)
MINYSFILMTHPHQDWTQVILNNHTKTKTSVQTQTVVKHNVNTPSNGVKVKKIWDPKDPNAEPEIRPVMVTHEFGQQIQQTRTAKGITQKELANAVCIPVSIINDYERGAGVHNSNHISKIKKYLGITKHKV